MNTTEIKDWHAHVYFDPATRDPAWALRERIEKEFEIQMGRFHEKPVGPHRGTVLGSVRRAVECARLHR